METRWVRQEHPLGCGIACLAMILQVTYAEANDMFSIFNGTGVRTVQMDEFLACYGFAVARIWSRTELKSYRRRKRPFWPVKPFAPLHFCLVKVSSDRPIFHYVVMLEDGSVLDPEFPEPTTLAHYEAVEYITGVTRFK